MPVEWIKNQWLLAKSGEKSARRKLLALMVITVIITVLLMSGQNAAEPIRIKPAEASQAHITSEGYAHIAGEVRKPGVYPISAGMRLFELLALAGGFTPQAEKDSVNLARLVTDGEQIIVAGGGVASATDGRIHLNTADASDFDGLPGIGPTLSSRIIDWRKANGSFKSIEDLRKVGGIGDKLFAGLKSLVTL